MHCRGRPIGSLLVECGTIRILRLLNFCILQATFLHVPGSNFIKLKIYCEIVLRIWQLRQLIQPMSLNIIRKQQLILLVCCSDAFAGQRSRCHYSNPRGTVRRDTKNVEEFGLDSGWGGGAARPTSRWDCPHKTLNKEMLLSAPFNFFRLHVTDRMFPLVIKKLCY